MDGANISLPKGTGIAVYGKNLVRTLASSGHDAEILYGPAFNVGNKGILDEVAVFDARQTREKRGVKRALRTIKSRFGVNAYPVVKSGNINWTHIGYNDLEEKSCWASNDIYNLANRSFSKYNKFVPLHFIGSQPDVCHWTMPMPIFGSKSINIYTFHDLIPLQYPQYTMEDKQKYYRLIKSVIKKSDHIISVSQYTKDQLINLFGISDSSVTVTYQSSKVDGKIIDEDAGLGANILARDLGLDWKGYFLFFGAVEPKKNLLRIMEAYLQSGARYPLVVVGGRSWLADPDNDLLDQLSKPESFAAGVRRIEYLPSTMLHRVIKGARGVMFPSLTEGFGLPILEAMQLGTAVITSNYGAMKEISGDAAIHVDAHSIESISKAITMLDSDNALLSDLSQIGKERSEFFSNKNYLNRLDHLYKKIGIM